MARIAVSFVAPLAVVFLAWPLLGERITAMRVVAVVMGFAGVLVVIRPGSSVFQWASVLLLGSALWHYQLWTHRQPIRVYASGQPEPRRVQRRARRERGRLHGEPAARCQRAVHDGHGDQDAVRGARLASKSRKQPHAQ